MSAHANEVIGLKASVELDTKVTFSPVLGRAGNHLNDAAGGTPEPVPRVDRERHRSARADVAGRVGLLRASGVGAGAQPSERARPAPCDPFTVSASRGAWAPIVGPANRSTDTVCAGRLGGVPADPSRSCEPVLFELPLPGKVSVTAGGVVSTVNVTCAVLAFFFAYHRGVGAVGKGGGDELPQLFREIGSAACFRPSCLHRSIPLKIVSVSVLAFRPDHPADRGRRVVDRAAGERSQNRGRVRGGDADRTDGHGDEREHDRQEQPSCESAVQTRGPMAQRPPPPRTRFERDRLPPAGLMRGTRSAWLPSGQGMCPLAAAACRGGR